MIVVAIIGILAAVAIPAFSRYVKKSRTTEAFGHLNKMYAGAVTYYETDRVNWDGEPQPKQFPPNAASNGQAERCGCRGSGWSLPWRRRILDNASDLAFVEFFVGRSL